MARLAYRRVLARVAAVEGSVEQLAARLDVSSTLVTRWIEGRVPVPVEIFLKCVDLLTHPGADPGRVPPESAKGDPRRR